MSKITSEYLLKRINVFNDHDEVIYGLQEEVEMVQDGSYPYYLNEAITHIAGVRDLLAEVKKYLET